MSSSVCYQEVKYSGGDIDEEMEDQFYMQRLEAGLFTLQLVDHVMLEISQTGPSGVSGASNILYIQ